MDEYIKKLNEMISCFGLESEEFDRKFFSIKNFVDNLEKEEKGFVSKNESYFFKLCQYIVIKYLTCMGISLPKECMNKYLDCKFVSEKVNGHLFYYIADSKKDGILLPDGMEEFKELLDSLKNVPVNSVEKHAVGEDRTLLSDLGMASKFTRKIIAYADNTSTNLNESSQGFYGYTIDDIKKRLSYFRSISDVVLLKRYIDSLSDENIIGLSKKYPFLRDELSEKEIRKAIFGRLLGWSSAYDFVDASINRKYFSDRGIDSSFYEKLYDRKKDALFALGSIYGLICKKAEVIVKKIEVTREFDALFSMIENADIESDFSIIEGIGLSYGEVVDDLFCNINYYEDVLNAKEVYDKSGLGKYTRRGRILKKMFGSEKKIIQLGEVIDREEDVVRARDSILAKMKAMLDSPDFLILTEVGSTAKEKIASIMACPVSYDHFMNALRKLESHMLLRFDASMKEIDEKTYTCTPEVFELSGKREVSEYFVKSLVEKYESDLEKLDNLMKCCPKNPNGEVLQFMDTVAAVNEGLPSYVTMSRESFDSKVKSLK